MGKEEWEGEGKERRAGGTSCSRCQTVCPPINRTPNALRTEAAWVSNKPAISGIIFHNRQGVRSRFDQVMAITGQPLSGEVAGGGQAIKSHLPSRT